jgi:hypothetical protein
MKSSTRRNENKLDLTNLTPAALLPDRHGDNMLEEAVLAGEALHLVDCGDYSLPLTIFADTYPDIIETAAAVMNHGETVYGHGNWQIGMSKRSILRSLYRHVHAYYNKGEVSDPESGYSHLGHIYCNLMFLEFHSQKGFLPD